MEPSKKPNFSSGEKVIAVATLLLFSPIILLIILFMIGKMFLVYLPALRKIQTVPKYWLTWKHVKLLTGLSTSNTLSLLKHFADDKFMECRLREDTQLQRIRELRKDNKVPTSSKPFFSEHVIYYEFRIVWRGGRKRPKRESFFRSLVPQGSPQPALVPA
jgi:hypothetical protein